MIKILGDKIMPPSGFNRKAVNGLLTFLEACYEDLLKEVKNSKNEGEAVKKELKNIRNYLQKFEL